MAGRFKNKRGSQPSRKERNEKKKAKVIPIEPEPTTIPDIGTGDFDTGDFLIEESEHNDQSITQDIIEKPQFEIPDYSPKTKVMGFKPINVLYYGIALIFPIVLFTVILNNYNETHRFPVFLLCIVLMAGAGYLSVPGQIFANGKFGDKFKWMCWSVLVGIIEAVLLCFAF